MEIIIEPDYGTVCDRAAQLVQAELARKPDLVLGLATGKTPLGLYERLRRNPEAFAKVICFNLDELYGLGPENPASFHSILRRHFVDHVKMEPRNVRLLRGDVKDLEAASDAYEASIRAAGGIDLQLLGLGRNGHIAFNEPGSSLGSRTRPKTLTPETMTQYLDNPETAAQLPNWAITMGIGTIMEARKLLMMVSGADKAQVVEWFVEGPLAAEVPASMTQLHPRAVVILDEAAASRLKRVDYYKWVFANKWRVGQK